jgi:hypothetical protein
MTLKVTLCAQIYSYISQKINPERRTFKLLGGKTPYYRALNPEISHWRKIASD